MDTADIVSMLNEYFAALANCISRHDGTIDKFIGDAILAVFGSPEADPLHHRNAIVAAMEMQQAVDEVNRQRISRGQTTCQVGIGVHSGEVLHGFIGSPERMEFTIIGDTVNRSARYCDGAKASKVLIRPETYQHVWRMIEAEQTTIATKHEGDFEAYRVKSLRVAGTSAARQ
jgi:adenylate cyclase